MTGVLLCISWFGDPSASEGIYATVRLIFVVHKDAAANIHVWNRYSDALAEVDEVGRQWRHNAETHSRPVSADSLKTRE